MRGLTFPQAKILARAHFTAAPNTKALSGYHPSQVLKEGFAPNGITKRTWCAINFRGFPAAVTA
jgi:pyrroline-5-carboxylate reductase